VKLGDHAGTFVESFPTAGFFKAMLVRVMAAIYSG
jgi:hypothetical protein